MIKEVFYVGTAQEFKNKLSDAFYEQRRLFEEYQAKFDIITLIDDGAVRRSAYLATKTELKQKQIELMLKGLH